jgi:hypothetical protein
LLLNQLVVLRRLIASFKALALLRTMYSRHAFASSSSIWFSKSGEEKV